MISIYIYIERERGRPILRDAGLVEEDDDNCQRSLCSTNQILRSTVAIPTRYNVV